MRPEEEDWILRNVSFTVEPGETAAFGDRTGAGKTAITNLLLRFYEIQRGQILLDGIDIRELHPAELRASRHGAQEIFLVAGDIISNIRLEIRSIPETSVRVAARDLHLEEFIVWLENSYQSGIFEGGAGLSVGQKQLVRFARAFALDRPILNLGRGHQFGRHLYGIANSRRDPENDGGPYALVIAHRLSTIQSVDRPQIAARSAWTLLDAAPDTIFP